MKVSISVPGEFHFFELAAQLEKRGYLSQLITSYPVFLTSKHGIPHRKINSIFLKEILQRGWQKLPFLHRFGNPQFHILELFDVWASHLIKPSDIFVGASSASLHTLVRAKKLGARTILERGSAHILYQNRILREEYEGLGIRPSFFQVPHPKIIEKELSEYQQADYISIPSLFVKRTFLDAGMSERKLIHVPYGVDLTRFQPITKNDGVFHVIFAGGITLQKGVHYLLQGFAELNLPHADLLLAGAIHDEMRPFLDRYRGHYKWLGHISQRELAYHYSRSSVFVLNSIQDGLGMVILQAMACGLPVIATTNTGAEDVIRDGKDGFIIPIRDLEALKKKILYLYEHPEEREHMGRSAKARVSGGFTWDDYGSRMIKEYERILVRHT